MPPKLSPPASSQTSQQGTTKHAGRDLAREESIAGKRLDRASLLRAIKLLRPVRGIVWALIGFELILVATVLFRPTLFQIGIDDGLILDDQGYQWVPQVIAWVVGILAASWVLRFIMLGITTWLGGDLALKVLSDLRQQVVNHVYQLDLSYFDHSKAGRIVARADSDVAKLEPLLVYGPSQLISSLLRCVGAGILLWLVAPPIFLVLAPVLPALILFMWVFKNLGVKLWGRLAEARSQMTAQLVESINGYQALQQSVAEQQAQWRYDQALSGVDRASIKVAVGWSWFLPFIILLFTMGLCAVLLRGGYLIDSGDLTIGQLTQCIFYVFLFLGPIADLSDLFERGADGVAAARRIFLLLDTPVAITNQAVAKPHHGAGEIVIDHLSFRYDPDGPVVLNDISTTIHAGETVAVVGATGHGKSTLVQLFGRMYDTEPGMIVIDGTPVHDYDLAVLRRHIGIVLQDNVLFNGTVLDNLRSVAPQASDAQLIQAIEDLGADEVLSRLPLGYHSEVGPSGERLSHGQRQLVCLVRAYLVDPAILILDEATSAIDLYTERRIQRALQRLTTGRTAIVIAHRLATIRDADRILVLKDGCLVEDGHHDQLIAAGGTYQQLYQQYQRGEQL